MKKFISIIFLSILFFTGETAFAQKDSVKVYQSDSSAMQTDSVNAAILKIFNRKVDEIEKLRIADSITKANLVREISSLQNSDKLKKEELQKQLEQLKDQEALRYEEKKNQIDSLRLTAKGYPVLGFFEDTLFFIFNKSGSFSAQERAEAIHRRIKDLSGNYRLAKDSVEIVSSENYTDLYVKDQTIVSISDNDAIWENTSRDTLAARYQKIINNEIVRYQHETSVTTLVKEILLALFLIVLFVFIIKYIFRLFRWTSVKISQQKDILIKGIQIRNYTLFDSSKEVNFLLNLNNVVKWLLVFLVIYLALPIIFGIFPWTENYASTLFGYILNPLKKIASSFWNFVP
ncbi:MAG: hypothetical protein ABI366_11390, partial [Ginsengibacter sp.]